MANHNLPFNQRKRIGLLKVSGLFLMPLLFFTQNAWTNGTVTEELLELTGIFLLLGCVAGRIYSTIFIGGHKNKTLITNGPYSLCRNPLYFFSCLGVTGIGLMMGSLVLAMLFFVTSYLVFTYTIKQEEAYLANTFNDAYQEYCGAVPSFFPQITGGRTLNMPENMQVNLATLHRTARDAATFILALPLIELLEWLQTSGMIKPVLLLY